MLEEVFSAPEKDLKTFKDTVEEICKDDNDLLKMGGSRSSGVVQRHRKQQKFITIEYQWNGDDFVWHIAPHQRKTWKVDSSRLLLVIAKIINPSLPKNTLVDIWRPIANMVPEWSFRAYNVKNHWSFDEDKLNSSVEELLCTLNTLV